MVAGRAAWVVWLALVCAGGCTTTARGVGTVMDAAPDATPADGSPHFETHFTSASCGNGSVESPEECDDGNHVAGDGCYGCLVECPTYNPFCRVTPTAGLVCGDGVVAGGEGCDDGNVVAGDGCSAGCAIERGWTCPLPGRRCFPICGDGVVTPPETCDDENQQSGDGCSSTCLVETPCFAADGSPAPCPPTCGNGRIDGSEACDDGPLNADTSGACSTTCQRVYFCGDGIVSPPETCDPGPTNLAPAARYTSAAAAGCTAACTLSGFCGDGHTDTGFGEQCDLGSYNGQLALKGSDEQPCVVCSVQCLLIVPCPSDDAGSSD